MYIENNNKKYSCTGYRPTALDVRFEGVDGATFPLTGEIILYRNDGFKLATQTCESYVRQTYENGIILLTNEPEPILQPTPEPAQPPQPTTEERLLELQTTAAANSADFQAFMDYYFSVNPE